MSKAQSSAPQLSTPATHIFEDDSTPNIPASSSERSDEHLIITYEIERTVAEIKEAKWKRIALQFPDEMLPDAPRVSQLIRHGLRGASSRFFSGDTCADAQVGPRLEGLSLTPADEVEAKPYILGDTSYGACCVDEIAAEHISADVVVHYGRSCLSPTARLPVIYVFTRQSVDVSSVIQAFVDLYPEKDRKVILTGDIPFHYCLEDIQKGLIGQGYTNTSVTEILHNPSSLIPNRCLPSEVQTLPENLQAEKLGEYDLFHISQPPSALLLTLSSRVRSIHIYPTSHDATITSKPIQVSTASALRRRYALVTSVSAAPIIGLLINTLSVKNYLYLISHIQAQIHAAGKKSYTFVVGKINAAKIANFEEVGAWVVVGCWESSLVESKDFWRPVITPFELELALKGNAERVWTKEWRSNFQDVLDGVGSGEKGVSERFGVKGGEDGAVTQNVVDDEDDIQESDPPEFDLRTGRYVSNPRPMKPPTEAANGRNSKDANKGPSDALIRRGKGELPVVGGKLSPGAEYLRSKRTWKGLGSDFNIAYDEGEQANGALIEEGRSGIARNYAHGSSSQKT